MISYEIYKVLHVSSIIFLMIGLGAYYTSSNPGTLVKIFTGIASLLTFVGGMGLMARIGVTHGEMWPAWILGKVAIWFLIAFVGIIVAKRLPGLVRIIYPVLFVLAIGAVYLAVFKPEF